MILAERKKNAILTFIMVGMESIATALFALIIDTSFYLFFMFLETIRDGTNLMSGSRLVKGEKLMSGIKCFKLTMREDGNLVLRKI